MRAFASVRNADSIAGSNLFIVAWNLTLRMWLHEALAAGEFRQSPDVASAHIHAAA
jgi:hypothetical protein